MSAIDPLNWVQANGIKSQLGMGLGWSTARIKKELLIRLDSTMQVEILQTISYRNIGILLVKKIFNMYET